ncbi:hypothetical protein ACSR0Z_28045 [Streptomyces viridosporus]
MDRYRELSQRALGQAASELNAMPQGQVVAAEIQARAAKAQAIATIAVAQALLEIGDVLRENLKRGDAHG